MLSALNVPGAGVVSFHNKNPEATIWIGNLSSQANEELVWELCCQAGPIVSLIMPRDNVTTSHEGYAFVEYETEEDANYAIKVLSSVTLYGRIVRLNKANKEDKETMEQQEWLVKLFIGGLAQTVDEVILTDVFSKFGAVIQARIAKDPDTNSSLGYGFVILDSFEAGDKAIETLNDQFIEDNPVKVSYAFKDDSKTERHGTPAERLLAQKVTRNHIVSTSFTSLSEMKHVGMNVENQTTHATSLLLTRPTDDQNYLADQNTANLTFSNTSTLPPASIPPPPGLVPYVPQDQQSSSDGSMYNQLQPQGLSYPPGLTTYNKSFPPGLVQPPPPPLPAGLNPNFIPPPPPFLFPPPPPPPQHKY